MHTKIIYTTPRTDVMDIRFESGLLVGSINGAQSEGFTEAGTYTDSDWDID